MDGYKIHFGLRDVCGERKGVKDDSWASGLITRLLVLPTEGNLRRTGCGSWGEQR